MDLIEIKENLQSEYKQLESELNKLIQLYKELKKQYNEMNLKDTELYYELETLSNELNEDTQQEEENEKQYIMNNSEKLLIKLPFSIGIIGSLIVTIILLLNSKFIINPMLSLGLIAGHLSSGMIIGIGIYGIYKYKYKTILKERYKNTARHREHSTNHYDKMINLMNKKTIYNQYHQEYLNIKNEYQALEQNLLNKEQELKEFKEKVFKIIFPNELENLDISKEILINEDNSKCSNCYYQEQKTYKKQLKKY